MISAHRNITSELAPSAAKTLTWLSLVTTMSFTGLIKKLSSKNTVKHSNPFLANTLTEAEALAPSEILATIIMRLVESLTSTPGWIINFSTENGSTISLRHLQTELGFEG
jgi:hypothetical protein